MFFLKSYPIIPRDYSVSVYIFLGMSVHYRMRMNAQNPLYVFPSPVPAEDNYPFLEEGD